MAGWRKKNGPRASGPRGPGREGNEPAEKAAETPATPAASPGKASWRKRKGQTAAAGDAIHQSTYRNQGRFWDFLSKRMKLLAVASFFAALVVCLALAVLHILFQPVPVVAIAVQRYDDPRIPSNWNSRRDVVRLKEIGRDFSVVPLDG